MSERIIIDREPRPEGVQVASPQLAANGLTAYINAGGRGTRLNSIFAPHSRTGVSKALLPVGKPPIALIEHQINKLTTAGLQTIVAGVGDHANVAQHVADIYPKDERVHTVHYTTQLGNGGDLVRAVREYPDLFGDDVLITNVDTLLDINEADFHELHVLRQAKLSIALTLNRGVPNEGAYYVGGLDEVLHCKETKDNPIPEEQASASAAYKGSSTGALIASRDMLHEMPWEPSDGPLSLYAGVVGMALTAGTMVAFNNGTKLFTDIGTPESWQAAQERHEVIAPYIHY